MMNVVQATSRAVTKAAGATTAAAGAVGGAAVNGVIGGVEGTVAGVRHGVDSGSRSTPAALLTLGAVAATGFVAWPVVLAVGGTAVLVNQLARSGDNSASDATTSTPRKRVSSRK